MTPVTEPCYIELDDRGVAWIAGTRVKVVEVVLDKLAFDWSPERIAEEHPHLPLSTIHAAFAYYYEHQQDMDRSIAEDLAEVDRVRTEAPPSPFVERLKREGLID